MTAATSAVAPPAALAVPVPWRAGQIGVEIFWFLAFALAIPLAVLAVGTPIALAVKLVFSLFGSR